jgi:hypothetical protein
MVDFFLPAFDGGRAASMKRALIEWSAIASIALAFASFLYWSLLSFSEFGDIYLALQPRVHLVAADAAFTFCDHPSNLEVLEILAGPNTLQPKPVSYHDWSLPGFRLRRAEFVDNSNWSLRISVLLVTLFFTAAAALCIYQFRSLRRAARAETITRPTESPWSGDA